MEEAEKKKVKKYFNSLVQKFIKDKKHHNITFSFKKHIESDGDIRTSAKIDFIFRPFFLWIFGWKKYRYKITFLNGLGEERNRENVVYEFTHLWLAHKQDLLHEHDDNFYSKMDFFEAWLDKKWNLPSRKEKGEIGFNI